MGATTLTSRSVEIAEVHLRALAGDGRARLQVHYQVRAWLQRAGLLSQDRWWVPQQGWGLWSDGALLAELDPAGGQVAEVSAIEGGWRRNLVAMLERMCPKLLEGRWLHAATNPGGDLHGAPLEEIAELVDDPAAGLVWLRSQPLLVALCSTEAR